MSKVLIIMWLLVGVFSLYMINSVPCDKRIGEWVPPIAEPEQISCNPADGVRCA